MQKKRLEDALNAGKLIKLGFNLNFSKPEKLNLLYTVRCANNKVIHANGEIKASTEPVDENPHESVDDSESNDLGKKTSRKESGEKNEEKVEILCLQFNPTTNMLATGNSNGHLQMHDIFTGSAIQADEAHETSESKRIMSTITKAVPKYSTVLNTPKATTYNMPIISIKWFPYNNYTTNFLYYAHVNGYIGIMNRNTMKKQLIIEEENEMSSMDFNNDGSYLAVVGRDWCIKMYDTNLNRQSLNKMVTKYGCHGTCHNSGNTGLVMHTNRLQAVKFSNMSNDVLYTGGWDKSVKIWDKRTPHGLVNTIHGPFICGGDGIDVCNYLVLTASWVKHEALELWDIRNCEKRLTALPLFSKTEGDSMSLDSCNSYDSMESGAPRKRGEYLYACKFFASNSQHRAITENQGDYTATARNPDNFSTVIAAGSGTQSVHLIDYEAPEAYQNITSLYCKSPLYCLDTMYGSSLIACGSMKKYLTLMTFNSQSLRETI